MIPENSTLRSWTLFVLTTSFMFIGSLRLDAQEQNDTDTRPYVEVAEQILKTALMEGQSYAMLAELTQKIGARLSGSPQAAAAVEWGRQAMLKCGLDSVYLQAVMVPHWIRGPVEEAVVINSATVGTQPLNICALGGSVATPELGLVGEVIEVQNFAEVHALGDQAADKIIFYNRPMDPSMMRTFTAYGRAVDQRSQGAIEAAKVGAAAVLVRSMTTRLDQVPHTGGMRYEDGVEKIPAAAISTADANFLSKLLRQGESVRVRLRLSCKTLSDVPSANVIGEITGTEFPNEVVLLGGHLDSWDKGQGAHDDGAGCVQSIEALRLLKSLGLKPKRTIRAVLFMNEENGLRGGRKYAEVVQKEGPRHLAGIESDRGGFTPTGISVQLDPEDDAFTRIARWGYLLEALADNPIKPGFGGADIGPLRDLGVVAMGLVVDPHRYFDYHHSDNDTFDKVNECELALGAATMAIIAYVLAMEGI